MKKPDKVTYVKEPLVSCTQCTFHQAHLSRPVLHWTSPRYTWWCIAQHDNVRYGVKHTDKTDFIPENCPYRE